MTAVSHYLTAERLLAPSKGKPTADDVALATAHALLALAGATALAWPAGGDAFGAGSAVYRTNEAWREAAG